MANSRLNTQYNLNTGANYDLLLVNTDPYPSGQLQFGFLSTPRKITGIQKVAQFFLKVLMTRQGSDVINPGFGTNFLDLCQQSNITTDNGEFTSSLRIELASAESQAQSYLNTTGNDPANTLDRIDILSITTDSDTLSTILYLNLVTGAGEYSSVAVPFPQLSMNLSD